MPAKINITSGITAGSSHWIERRVVRIGSEDCEICLPSVELAAHAVTLEFRDGKYYAHNKSRNTFRINNQSLAPQESTVWHPGQQFELAPDVILVLQTEADPSPGPAAVEAFEIPPPDDPSGTEEPGSGEAEQEIEEQEKSSTLGPLLVIILCVVGSVLLLMRSPKDSEAKKVVSFDTIMNQRQKTTPQLLERLQYAQAALVRGDQQAALKRFNRLRDQLVQQERSFREQDKVLEIQILDYVTYQLEKLN